MIFLLPRSITRQHHCFLSMMMMREGRYCFENTGMPLLLIAPGSLKFWRNTRALKIPHIGERSMDLMAAFCNESSNSDFVENPLLRSISFSQLVVPLSFAGVKLWFVAARNVFNWDALAT